MLKQQNLGILLLLGALTWSHPLFAEAAAEPKSECITGSGDQKVWIQRGTKRDVEAVSGDCSERSSK